MAFTQKTYMDEEALAAKEKIHKENTSLSEHHFQKLNQSVFTNHTTEGTQAAVVWMLSTYPPKECGIATFSQDLRQAVERVHGSSVKLKIAAIDNKDGERNYTGKAQYIFDSGDHLSYIHFANLINNDSQAKALLIQHEFGLFPNENQADFLEMLHEIEKPILLVMHTVIPSPSNAHRNKTTSLVNAAGGVIVMTERSARILHTEYNVPIEKIEIIPHGTHLLGHSQKNILKEKLGLKKRTVLSTFGLISRNKNIETSLKSLPSIIEKFPEVIFLVLGRLHPEVFKREGDSYYRELEGMVKKLNLTNHVKFVNRYLELDELMEYLQATDIYLFTSKDPAQAVSGTFAYALSSGCAIVSTPIPHAKELIENGSGLLFEFEDPKSLATQILRYLNEPVFREKISGNALELMANTAWENIAIRYVDTLKKTCDNSFCVQYNIPEINTEHLEKLTTEKGILQFARYNQPELSSGYTLDDNARALIVVTMIYLKTGSCKMAQLAEIYLQFIKDCQLPDGNFINYINEEGTASPENEDVNLEDSNGRAIWALGYLNKMLPSRFTEQTNKILIKAMPNFELVKSPRAIAFIIKGLYYFNSCHPSFELKRLIENLADKLSVLYQSTTDQEWKWFETYLTYANSILPEAMLIAYEVTSKNIYGQIARESFDFLLSKIFTCHQIKVIPNKGWLHKGKKCAVHGEQPIDVAYTILALDRFYYIYKDEKYLSKLKIAFDWFLGENHLKRIIYDPATGGCFDGLEENSVNLNQGAESTVSYLLARLTLDKYSGKENPDLRLAKIITERNLFQ